MKYFFIFSFSLFLFNLLGQNTEVNVDILNRFISKGVNELRNKQELVKVQPDINLKDAADDHANYMRTKSLLTHFQKRNKLKYDPKNRVDFYGGDYEVISENVQQINTDDVSQALHKNAQFQNYEEALANILVTNWSNSKGHLRNMLDPNHVYTWTSISITDDGKIFACQLFAGTSFKEEYKLENTNHYFKPVRKDKCKRKTINGSLVVSNDRNIYFISENKKSTNFRFAWPWSEGIAADIVRISQYPCKENNFFDAKPNVKGVLLDPVYRKDFRRLGTWNRNEVKIFLGTVPPEIEEPFEVNLVVISRKRTCANIKYNYTNTSFNLDIDLPLYLEKKSPYQIYNLDTLISDRIDFSKSSYQLRNSINLPENVLNWNLDTVILTGFASIEGDFKRNQKLFENRVEAVRNELIKLGVDSNLITSTAKENYNDFYEDIIDTPFEYLAVYDELQLKEVLISNNLANELEPILKEHRYVKFDAHFSKKDSALYEMGSLRSMWYKGIEENNIQQVKEIQLLYLGLLDELKIAEVDQSMIDLIPKSKKYMDVFFNLELFNYINNPTNLQGFNRFNNAINLVLAIDKKHKIANSAKIFFKSKELIQNRDLKGIAEFFEQLSRSKKIDKVFKYRILIETAIYHDYYANRNKQSAPRLAPSIKSYIRKAKLSSDELYAVSAFFDYTNDSKFAFEILKNHFLNTDSKNFISYFINLIMFNNVGLREKQKLKFFEAIATKKTDLFCPLFKQGFVNFQLFDDLNYKNLYCKVCD